MSKFLLLLLPLYVFAWELHKEVDGILIFKEHDAKFEFAQYKAEMTMPYTLKEVSTAIMNHHSYTSWLSDCIKADKEDSFVYILMNPPWPLNYRQVWAKIEKKLYRHKEIITLNSIDKKSSKHSAVWFNYLHAEFVLIDHNRTSTKVKLSLLGDPNGYLPTWLVNFMAWKIPYQSLYDLNQYLKSPKPLK